MTVNSYLTNLASSAIIRDAEKQSIRRSIATLEARLRVDFVGELSDQFIFGSYSRGTILPRHMDANSDIDYMVVFRDDSFRPQTYLDKLRRFVERRYTRSEIFQSNPTVVLSLNHIKFELVPAISQWFWGYKIPAKASAYEDWVSTNPSEFNQTLTDANRSNSSLIKPVVRLVKYWNANNGGVFDSFELEQLVAEGNYMFLGGLFRAATIQDYFYQAVDQLDVGWFASQWRRDKLNRAKTLIREAKRHPSFGNEVRAQQSIERLLPPVNALTGLLGSAR